MFTFAHISDLHMALRPKLSQLLGKRGLGYINWQRKRKYVHRPKVLVAITHDLKSRATDHIAVTGDLVNLSLATEYARARQWLDALGTPANVTVVPGNHDTYVNDAERMPEQFWGDYMRGDDGLDRFPFVRRRSGVALIALSTACPTGPFLATGSLGARQLARFADLLDQTREMFRAVLIHHPPVTPSRRFLRRLTDAPALRRVLAEKGAELLIHGHDHRFSLRRLEGPGSTTIPAIGVPSASADAPHGDEDGSGYHLFTVDGAAGAWSCELERRMRDADGTIRDGERLKIC
jgi:3',5'-cyclic AMP phosphodiesterase CpdA